MDRLNLCMAPLRGVTVAPYREAYARHFGGVDRAVSPFVTTVKGRKIKASVLREVDPDRNGALPLVPQLLSKDPDGVRVMLGTLRELGYAQVNLNLGCPYPMVRNRGRGSGLMADEVALRTVLDAACEAMPVGFSVKVRLGIEDSELLDERVELLNGYPLDEVIVHPRTAVQMYEGRVDVEAFARVLPRIRHRVVYNGDLYTVADVARIRERFPEVTHLMLGRGLVTDPFLPERLRGGEIAVGDAERRIKAFLAELLDRYEAGLFGPSPVLGRMKEVWGYLHEQFEDGDELLRRVQQSRSVEGYRRAVDAARWVGAARA